MCQIEDAGKLTSKKMFKKLKDKNDNKMKVTSSNLDWIENEKLFVTLNNTLRNAKEIFTRPTLSLSREQTLPSF